MFRAEDFDSNTVARFPVKFRTVSATLDSSDGVTPVRIYLAGPFDPGSKIKKIFVKNNAATTAVSVELRVYEEAGPFFNFTIAAGEVAELIGILEYEIELGANGALFLNLGAAVGIEDEVFVTVFANEY